MVYQSTDIDCGKACVRDVLFLVFEDEDYRYQTLKTECRSFYDIRTELESAGLDYISYDVETLDGITEDNLPAIALLKDENFSHFVVVRKIKNDKITIDDPQFGTVVLKKEDFLYEFSGKIMLLSTVGNKIPTDKIKIFKKSQIAFFLIMFLLESFSFFFFFYFLSQKDAQLFSVCFGILALVLIGIQVFISNSFRSKLDSSLFLPYLEYTKNLDDAKPLSEYLNNSIERANKLVSFGVLTLLACIVLTSNGFYLSLLSVLSILVGIFEVSFLRQRNQVNRYCSHKEQKYFNSLKLNSPIDRASFNDAKKTAKQHILKTILTKMLEIALYALLIYIYMSLIDVYTINFFLFNLMILISLQKATSSLVSSYIDDSKEVILLNSLSYPLSSFLIKNELTMGYNKSGGKTDEKAQTYDGLSGQDQSEEKPRSSV